MGGGGKGSAKQPATPDYAALAAQQGAINQETAAQLTAANRPNQYDAFGNSITWSQVSNPENDAKIAAAQAAYDEWEKKRDLYGDRGGAGGQAQSDKLKAALTAAQSSGGTWEQRQNLNPEAKAAWDKYNSDASAASSRYGDLLNSYLTNYQGYSANPDFAGGPQTGAFNSTANRQGDFSTTAKKMGDFSSQYSNVKNYNDAEFNGDSVADALYGSVMDRGRVEQSREKDSIDSQLRLQGLTPGTEAYNRSMQNLMTSQNDANLLAGQNAVLAGAQEGRNKYASYLSGNQAGFGNDLSSYQSNLANQAQIFGQDMSGYQANMANNSQNFGQDLSSYQANMAGNAQNYAQNANTYGINSQNALTNRNQPLQELSGLAGIAGGTPYTPTYTGFSSATGYNPTDLLGAAQATQAANQSKANAGASKKSGLLGSATSLGGSYLGSK